MTIQVGRNDIKLGWEIAVAVFLGIVGVAFPAGMYFSTYMAKQDRMYQMVESLVKKDSIKTEHIVLIDNKVSAQGKTLDSMLSVHQTAFYEKKRGRYLIERKVNGKLQFIEIDNPDQLN